MHPACRPTWPSRRPRVRQASFQRIAASRHERCAIIYDRGVLDVAAFLPRELWGALHELANPNPDPNPDPNPNPNPYPNPNPTLTQP